jgi:hypothetical protein
MASIQTVTKSGMSALVVLGLVCAIILPIAQSQSINNNYYLITQSENGSKTFYSALIGYNGNQTTYINATNPMITYLNLTIQFQSSN